MKILTLIKRNLLYYGRTNLSVILAAALSTALLLGGLMIGDTVRHSLEQLALNRIGQVHLALVAPHRYFRSELAYAVSEELGVVGAPVLALRGAITDGSEENRVNQVEILGVDDSFFKLAPVAGEMALGADEILLSDELAGILGVRVGQEILVRVDKPSILPRGVPMASLDDYAVTFRLTVKGLVGVERFGQFSLQAEQVSKHNAFVRLDVLGGKADLAGKANVILLGGLGDGAITAEAANDAIEKFWQTDDLSLAIRAMDGGMGVELTTGRIFLESAVVEAAEKMAGSHYSVLGYFANELKAGHKACPYSFVAALEKTAQTATLIHPDMADDEIIVNQWLADDIGVKVGDTIDMSYYVISPLRKLEEQRTVFTVRAVVPIEGLAADGRLMPEFPGMADSENCRDWKPGIPIDLDKIRDKDEDYWDKYRGVPKAFVTLSAGRKLWGNRFGETTAVRYADMKDGLALGSSLMKAITPVSTGLTFRPVREQAFNAVSQSMDFGQLFLSLSFFLIFAALLLLGLMFGFGVEQRSEEIGTLKAMGYTSGQVRNIFLKEGMVQAILGAGIGVLLSFLYVRVMVYQLATSWKGALGISTLQMHMTPMTLVTGVACGIITAMLAIWFTSRRLTRRSARELLNLGRESVQISSAGKIAKWVGVIATTGALGLVGYASMVKGSAGLFFGGGGLLLVGLLAGCRCLFGGLQVGFGRMKLTLSGLALRNTSRRGGRSLAIVAMLACGVFMVIAVGANRHDPLANAGQRDSGTGGFRWIARSSIPVYHDMNTAEGRDAFGLDDGEMRDVSVVHLRVHEGDDISCLNLNHAQSPQVVGVDVDELSRRGAFGFAGELEGIGGVTGWDLLKASPPPDVVYGITDMTTIQWALKKSLGDDIDYVDEQGRAFKVRLVAGLKNSILQGNIIISEKNFLERFPSESGCRIFLVDSTEQASEAVAKNLTWAMADVGFDLQETPARLADFMAVENTYLNIFAILGGMGLLLGSLGLGLVVLRNVLERRNEFAMLRAVGYDRRALGKLVLYEHWGVLLLGLVCGAFSALVAIWPVLRGSGEDLPLFSLGLTLVAVAISGIIWIALAASLALRGELMGALRAE